MINPLISIIIASYNSAKTINKTLDSIFNQTYRNFELIIIDGGSTDDTIEIIKKFEFLFKHRLKWISEEDSGIYEAWNKAISLSSGSWVSFIGSDDYYVENALENYISIINLNKNVNFVSSNCLLVDYNYKKVREYGRKWSDKMLTYCVIAHVGSFHKRDLFNSPPYFDTRYRISADYDFLLKNFKKINATYFPTVTVIVMNSGISGRNIFFVAKERTLVKLRNNSKPILFCFIDFFVTILKFYFRKYFL